MLPKERILRGSLHISQPSSSDGHEVVVIEVEDKSSGVEFVELEVGLADFTRSLRGRSVPCRFVLRNPNNVGLKGEHKVEWVSVPRPFPWDRDERRKILAPLAAALEVDGWSWNSGRIDSPSQGDHDSTNNRYRLHFKRFVPEDKPTIGEHDRVRIIDGDVGYDQTGVVVHLYERRGHVEVELDQVTNGVKVVTLPVQFLEKLEA